MGEKLPPWHVLSSRNIVNDRWIKMRADTCETAEGVRIDPFYVIETPDVGVAVAITSGGEIVLVRQYRHGFGGPVLELPAGRIDAGEDPVQACLRELVEETGYSGGETRLLRTVSLNPMRYANRLHVVLTDGVQLTDKPADDPTERIELQLWPLETAGQILFEPDFINSAHAGALAIALAALHREGRAISA